MGRETGRDGGVLHEEWSEAHFRPRSLPRKRHPGQPPQSHRAEAAFLLPEVERRIGEAVETKLRQRRERRQILLLPANGSLGPHFQREGQAQFHIQFPIWPAITSLYRLLAAGVQR